MEMLEGKIWPRKRSLWGHHGAEARQWREDVEGRTKLSQLDQWGEDLGRPPIFNRPTFTEKNYR